MSIIFPTKQEAYEACLKVRKTLQSHARMVVVVVKNWPPSRCCHVSKRPSPFEATMSSSSFSSLCQILLEFHHFRTTFPSQKALPYPGATFFSEDIALRKPLLPQKDTSEITYSPRPPALSQRLQQRPQRSPPAVTPLHLSHVEDVQPPAFRAGDCRRKRAFLHEILTDQCP